MKKPSCRVFLIVLMLLAAILACNFSPKEGSDDRSATLEALSTSVAGTTTAISKESIGIQPGPPEQAPSTEAPIAVQVTEDMQATEMAGQYAATEAAIAPIKAELSRYGVDPQNGQLAYVHPPLRLETDQYMGKNFGTHFPTVIAQDFVLSSDITWDTKYGLAGCAFVFRSDGNQSAPNQYMVWMTRLTSGRVEFIVTAHGDIVNVQDFYANGIDPSFDGSNGAINKLTIVGRGNKFTIFTNGVKVGVADPNAPLPNIKLPVEPIPPANIKDPVARAAYQKALAEYKAVVARLKEEYNRRLALWKKVDKNFPAGIVAFGALAESGYTICEFNNTYLWLIGP